MGNMQAYSWAESVVSGLATLDQALCCHLSSNHWPAIPGSMVPVAKAAISAIQDEEFDRLIHLPEGVISQRYGKDIPAQAVAEELHLWPFVAVFDENLWYPQEEQEEQEEQAKAAVEVSS